MQNTDSDQSSSKPPQSTRRLKLKLWLIHKFQPNELTVTLIGAGLVGILGGLSSILFRKAISFIQFLYTGSGGNILEAALQMPLSLRILIPTLGAAVAGLIIYIGFQVWKEIPSGTDILEAIFIKEGVLRLRPSLLKATSSLFSIASGASLGREGSILQLSAMSASKLGQYLKVTKQQLRLLTACGVAAGFAGAYNAPIAGAMFVMEVILGNFAIEIFGPLVFSSVIATIISQGYFGSNPIYNIPTFTLVSYLEIIPYIILGILGGLLAPLFQVLLNSTRQFFTSFKLHPLVNFLIGGLVMGLIAIQYPHLWGNGYETVDLILHEQLVWKLVLLLLVLKAVSTSVCLGSGMVGGLFTPTLFLGASLGAVFGYWIHFFFPNITGSPGGYALVGMGCLVAGTTHAPLTAILILFELTLNYSIILPLLLGCAISTFVARQIRPQSVYSEELERKGAFITNNPEALVMTSMTVHDIYSPTVESIKPDTDFAEIVDKFFHIRRNNIYVTNNHNKFLGAVSLNDLKDIILQEHDIKFVLAYDIMNPNFLFTTPTERLSSVMEKFWLQDCERLPGLSNTTDKLLLGTVSKRDILGLYSQEVLGKHHLLTRFDFGPESDLQTTYVELGQNIIVETLPVPDNFTGLTLANLNIRARYHIQVMLIRRKDSTRQELKLHPSPDFKLQKGDHWVVMGDKTNLNKFKEQMKNPFLGGFFHQDGAGI